MWDWMDRHPGIREISGEALTLVSPKAGNVMDAYALLPQFPRLRGWLKERRVDGAVPPHVDAIPILLNSCYYSMDLLQEWLALAMRATGDTDDQELRVCKPYDHGRAAVPLDAFLTNSVRLQNQWLSILAVTMPASLSLPSSLRDAVSQMEKGNGAASALEERFQRNLLAYWETHGRLLRDYRNYVEHYGSVVSDLRVFRTAAGELAAVFLLANNPGLNRPSDTVWGDPPIHALLYVISELQALVGFTNWLCDAVMPIHADSAVLSTPLIRSAVPTFAGTGLMHRGVIAINPEWIVEQVRAAVTGTVHPLPRPDGCQCDDC